MNVLIKASDVQNIVKRANLKALSGKTHTRALMEHLINQETNAKVAVDEDNHVRHLFWQPQHSVDFIRRYNKVFVIDCTYKTNAYGLPLLHVVGFTCTNQTFTAAVGFMDGEAFDDYVWMINEIDTILRQAPNILVVDCDFGLIKAITEKWPRAFFILCRFHIAKNIITRCRINFLNAGEECWKSFMDHWNAIVHAPTDDLFMQLWQQLPTIAVSFPMHVVIIWLTHSYTKQFTIF